MWSIDMSNCASFSLKRPDHPDHHFCSRPLKTRVSLVPPSLLRVSFLTTLYEDPLPRHMNRVSLHSSNALSCFGQCATRPNTEAMTAKVVLSASWSDHFSWATTSVAEGPDSEFLRMRMY